MEKEGDPARVEAIVRELSTVEDPELRHNIVELGMVYAVRVDGDTVHVRMTFTTPACPYGPMLREQTVFAAERPTWVKKAEVEVVSTPPWSLERASDEIQAKYAEYM
jgi:metal-sulfur cluster biosynthetic enzyme